MTAAGHLPLIVYCSRGRGIDPRHRPIGGCLLRPWLEIAAGKWVMRMEVGLGLEEGWDGHRHED